MEISNGSLQFWNGLSLVTRLYERLIKLCHPWFSTHTYHLLIDKIHCQLFVDFHFSCHNLIANIPILPEAFLTFASKSSVGPSHTANIHPIFYSLEYALHALSEEIAHPTVYHHLSQVSVDNQLSGLTKCRENSGVQMKLSRVIFCSLGWISPESTILV